jgi:acyl carrier protein
MTTDASSSPNELDATLRERMVAFLQSLNLDLGRDLYDETPLLGSGLLDSLRLVQLAAWIESEIGHPLDPERFDLFDEWQTLGKVLEFIRRYREV